MTADAPKEAFAVSQKQKAKPAPAPKQSKVSESEIRDRLDAQKKHNEELKNLREQELCKRQNKTLIAQKRAQGLSEVFVGNVITLFDLESKTEEKYYLASDKQVYRSKTLTYVETYDQPPGGADFCVHKDSAMGQALVGSFVNDEILVDAPGGAFTYLILDVKPCHTKQPTKKVAPINVKRSSDAKETHPGIGSEVWCFIARDNGQFGSFASHDNYGDESNAEANDNTWLESMAE